MTAQEKYNYYDPNNWKIEYQSGYMGRRNKNTQHWIYENEYSNGQFFIYDYNEALKLINKFRGECLPFGQYPDFIILEFLEKHFAEN